MLKQTQQQSYHEKQQQQKKSYISKIEEKKSPHNIWKGSTWRARIKGNSSLTSQKAISNQNSTIEEEIKLRDHKYQGIPLSKLKLSKPSQTLKGSQNFKSLPAFQIQYDKYFNMNAPKKIDKLASTFYHKREYHQNVIEKIQEDKQHKRSYSKNRFQQFNHQVRQFQLQQKKLQKEQQHKRLNSMPITNNNFVLAKNFDPTATYFNNNNNNYNNNINNSTKKVQQKKMLSLLINEYDPTRHLNQVIQQDDQSIHKEKIMKIPKNLDIMPKKNMTNIELRKNINKQFESKNAFKKLSKSKISEDLIKSSIPQNINLKTIQLERELLRKGRQPTLISKQSVMKRQSESLPSPATIMRKNMTEQTLPKVKIMSLKEKKEQEDRKLQQKHTEIFDIVGKAMKIARNDKITLFQDKNEEKGEGAVLMSLNKNKQQSLQLKTAELKEKEDSAEMKQFFSQTANQFTKIFGRQKKEDNKEQVKEGIRKKRWRVAQQILNLLMALKVMKISPRAAIKNNVFPKVPFQHKNSYEFIKAAKIGNTQELENLLDAQPQLVHDFDYVHQTAVHWAAKRNTIDILKILLSNGGNPNLKDMGGRTPLFLASKLGCLASVKMLLAHRAKPNIRADSGQSPIDVAFNYKVKSFLMKARSLQIFSQFAPKQDRQKAWREEGLKFFEEQSLDQLPEFIR